MKQVRQFVEIRSVADAGGQVLPRLVDEFYTAAYIGVSVQTVRRMRARRARGETGPAAGPAFVRIMSAVRYDIRDLDTYIEALPRAGAIA